MLWTVAFVLAALCVWPIANLIALTGAPLAPARRRRS